MKKEIWQMVLVVMLICSANLFMLFATIYFFISNGQSFSFYVSLIGTLGWSALCQLLRGVIEWI